MKSENNNQKTKIITLIITHNCNLRCSYCYVNDYTKDKNMSVDTAKKIIEKELESNKVFFTEFTFLGGEPFCNFGLIKEVTEWAWKKFRDYEYIFSAATNGTLLDEEIKSWLTKNRDRFVVTLSYDGSEASQNINRCGSSNKIDLEFFKKTYPKTPFKMTVSKNSLPNLAKDIISLKENGFLVNDTLSSDIDSWDKKDTEIFDNQLKELCEYEINHQSKPPSFLLNLNLEDINSRPKENFPCGANRYKFTYDYDGKIYPCHVLSPLVLKEQLNDFDEDSIPVKKDEICKNCFLDSICPLCDALSYQNHKCFGKRLKNQCEVFKIQLKHACKFKVKTLLKQKNLTQREKHTLITIKKLFQKLITEQ